MLVKLDVTPYMTCAKRLPKTHHFANIYRTHPDPLVSRPCVGSRLG